METALTTTRFQHICKASSETIRGILAEQMQGITITKLCEEPEKYLSLSGISKGQRQKLERVLVLMIGEMALSVNVTNNLKPHQIPMLASHIISDFGFMTLEAVYLCLKEIMLGNGDIYRIDIPFVCQKLREFDDDWYKEFSRIRDSKHLQDKGSMKTQFTDAAVTLYRKHENK